MDKLFAGTFLLVFLAVANASDPYETFSIGTLIQRDYTKYTSMPTTESEAVSSGDWFPWNGGSCDPYLGKAYAQSSSGPIKSKPLVLYFTAAGQAAGVGVQIYDGTPIASLISKGYYTQVSGGYYISVTFREGSVMCDGSTSSDPLGDRLIINAGGLHEYLPLTADEALAAGFYKGSCFKGMGTHWFYDLEDHPNMSWQAANVLPIVPMYFNNKINAFFFTVTINQNSLFNNNQWEPIPLINYAMCKNLCSNKCTFAGTSIWSTLHIYMNDRTPVVCPNGCGQACCPGPGPTLALSNHTAL